MRYMDGKNEYVQDLEELIDKYWLPAGWFETPDHIAVKCSNSIDFEDTLDWYKDKSAQLSLVEMDGRRLAAAKMFSSITIASLGSVEWVEIMEPRPEKIGRDVVGFEHMEFYYPDFEAIKDILKDRRIKFEMQKNPGHAWINVVLNSAGQEVKFNDKPLSEVVAHEIETGQSLIVN